MKCRMWILFINFFSLFEETFVSDAFFSVLNSCWECLWKEVPSETREYTGR